MAAAAYQYQYQCQYQFQHLMLLLLLIVVPLVFLLIAGRRRRASSSSSRHRHYCNDKQQRLPPSPSGKLPIIGHLHLVGDRPQVSLRDLAGKCSDSESSGLMLLRLGTVPTLVASSPRAARAVLRTHDHVFASRPTSTFTDGLLYGTSDVAFAPYGEHWRQVRKLVTTHFFTVNNNDKVQSLARARLEEARLVVARIRDAAAAAMAVDVSEAMNSFSNDVVCRAVSGKFSREGGRNKLFRELIEANVRLIGGFNLEDYFPALANSFFCRSSSFLTTSNGRQVQQAHKAWDDLLETLLTDHETRNNRCHDDDDTTDFIDVLLSIQQDYGITRDHVKAILMDMFGAGTDTSSLVLELSMAELMRNPPIMAKLQAEVRRHTPRGQQMVKEENLASMAYLKAVIKETLRLHPPLPLLLPHFSMADCVVDGYNIPSGTKVIINIWAIARDPESWERPEEFMPERFMSGGSAAALDFKGKDFQFLPFGAGRRICPGINFGLATVEIMLANLMYCFDWGLPVGMVKEDINMTEVFALTIHLKEKLLLVPKVIEEEPYITKPSEN